MKYILFVCTGNTCRSSMAEGILKDAVKKDKELAGRVTAASVGIAAFNGDSASQSSIKVLNNNWRIDISSHRARRISEAEIKKADLILTMTLNHKNHILSMFPWAANKVFALKEYTGRNLSNSTVNNNYDVDIVDPFGGDLNFYKKCGEEIKKEVEKLVSYLKNDI